MNQVDKLNKLIAEFNNLVDRRLKAEKWFDLPGTTDTDREKWKPTIINIKKETEEMVKQLENEGFKMKPEFWWKGI